MITALNRFALLASAATFAMLPGMLRGQTAPVTVGQDPAQANSVEADADGAVNSGFGG